MATTQKKTEFKFRGLMAPVFTPFRDNLRKTINIQKVPEYARYLLKIKIQGVLVNGTTGEGPSMTCMERKVMVREWSAACKETKQTLMVQVGGAALPDVIDMAKHAESMKVDAILCLPELYFKPTTIDELIKYLTKVALAAPNTPLLYYHIPSFTNVTLNMPMFLREAKDRLPTLVGIKFTSNDLNEGAACLQVHYGRYVIFLGADQIICGAFALGFDSVIATTLNMYPFDSMKMLKAFYVKKNKNLNNSDEFETLTKKIDVDINTARYCQKHLNEMISIIANYGSWVCSMKAAMNAMSPINVGPCREPLAQFNKYETREMHRDIALFWNAANVEQ